MATKICIISIVTMTRRIASILLGIALHFTGQEAAQYMAAGRLIDCITDCNCRKVKPAGVVERILGYRINLGTLRYRRFYEDYSSTSHNVCPVR
jgi:hypothetical protein